MIETFYNRKICCYEEKQIKKIYFILLNRKKWNIYLNIYYKI